MNFRDEEQVKNEMLSILPLLCVEATAFKEHVHNVLVLLTIGSGRYLAASEHRAALSALDLSLVLQKAFTGLADAFQSCQGELL